MTEFPSSSMAEPFHTMTLQEQLEAFAATHKKQIATDPQFRAQFNKMCREVGVDPLQCASRAILICAPLTEIDFMRFAPSFGSPAHVHSQEGFLGGRSWAR